MRIIENIEELGHNDVIIKGDQEPPRLALRDKIEGSRKLSVIVNESPVKEYQSNGMIENTCRTEQGRI